MVRHRNSARFYTRMRVCGHKKMIAFRTDDQRAARIGHANALTGAERQRPSGRPTEEGPRTLGGLLITIEQEYVANTALAVQSKRTLCSTIKRMVTNWKRCFRADLRALRPEDITLDKARRFANYLHSEARHGMNGGRRAKLGYKATTVNTTLEVLHRSLRLAVEAGLLPSLPFELNPVIGGPLRKREIPTRPRLPTTAKMKELFEFMRAVPDPLPENLIDMREYLAERGAESSEFAQFMAYSGARRSEASAFAWEDELPDSIILRGTKTESSRDREVPKILALRDLLQRMRERRNATARPLKGKAFQIKQCREKLDDACKRVGVERMTHHSLRHFFATICIEAGVDIPTVSRWLGHADGGVLAMRTYGHLRREHSFAAAAKVLLN